MKTRKPKKIANNTWLITWPDGHRSIRFHTTDIITERGEFVVLNSDGWETVTTKNRINRFLDSHYRLVQEHFIWKLISNNDIMLFHDNISIKGKLNI